MTISELIKALSTSSMLERMARAFSDSGVSPGWDDMSSEQQAWITRKMAAALAVLREPDVAMSRAMMFSDEYAGPRLDSWRRREGDIQRGFAIMAIVFTLVFSAGLLIGVLL